MSHGITVNSISQRSQFHHELWSNHRNREPVTELTWCSRGWETHSIGLIVPKLWMATLDWEHREWITVNEWSRQAISNLHSKIIQSPGLLGVFPLQYKYSIISILCSVMVLQQQKKFYALPLTNGSFHFCTQTFTTICSLYLHEEHFLSGKQTFLWSGCGQGREWVPPQNEKTEGWPDSF